MIIKMRTLSEIYASIKNSFKKKTGIDVTEGSAIDSYLLASSEQLAEAHEEIENAKNPHIYTNLSGDDIDKLGLLINCSRYPNESDTSYLYRCMNWTLINESSNSTAIESALSNLTYSSNATYVPYTQGTGTATVFLIPISYGDTADETEEALAISEAKERLSKVVSPDSYIKYQVCKPIGVEVIAYASFGTIYDEASIKQNIELQIKDYINNIPIGSSLSYGAINKIGLGETGVNFFNASHIYIGEIDAEGYYERELLSALSITQLIETKFLFKSIEWRTVTS